MCLCTRRLISIQPERTFARLRYSLGGDRPSQTAYQTLSSDPLQGRKLGIQPHQGSISRMAPPTLARRLPSLLPILHRCVRIPVPSYSQGSRGLSVLSRAHGIFTANSISLSLWSRQGGSRFAIRAGRNLPAKEFRYLRTVIVTAAVYRGFRLPLRPKD